MVTETDKELALVVLGLALASREMLEQVKASLSPKDFGPRLLGVANAVFNGDKELLSKEVKDLWRVPNGSGKTGAKVIQEFIERCDKRNLSSMVNSLVVRTMSLDKGKAKDAIGKLTSLLKEVNELTNPSAPEGGG